jgi:hypothetical protein
VVDVVPDPRDTSVAAIDVLFSEPLDRLSFDLGDLSLTRDRAPVILEGARIERLTPTWFRVTGLAPLTSADGSYTFTANAAGVRDVAGNSGAGTASDGWRMDARAAVSRDGDVPGAQQQARQLVSFTDDEPTIKSSVPIVGVDQNDVLVMVNSGAFAPRTALAVDRSDAVSTGGAGPTYVFTNMAANGPVTLEPQSVASGAPPFLAEASGAFERNLPSGPRTFFRWKSWGPTIVRTITYGKPLERGLERRYTPQSVPGIRMSLGSARGFLRASPGFED